MKLIDTFNVYRGFEIKGGYAYKGVRCPVCGHYVLNIKNKWLYQQVIPPQGGKQRWIACCKKCYRPSISGKGFLTMVYAFPGLYTGEESPVKLRSYYDYTKGGGDK